MLNNLLALLGMGRRHHATRLTDSYVKHFFIITPKNGLKTQTITFQVF